MLLPNSAVWAHLLGPRRIALGTITGWKHDFLVFIYFPPGIRVLAPFSCSFFFPSHWFEQDPYLVVKWGEQEVRTSAKRDSGKDCSWPKEEFALIVRMKKQLQEPLEIEVRLAHVNTPPELPNR